MSKRSTFTTISPLPAGIPREVVIDFLHNHQEMIDLNPLIIERHQIPPPAHALDEETRCVWWSMTDKISYLPGGLMSGEVVYTAAFNDLPNGVQTHCYAPLGTDIRERWSLGGTLPGEPLESVELGLGAPRQGLYLREDVELRCNLMMSSFVKKTLKKAHGALVERLCQKAAVACSRNPSPVYSNTASSNGSIDSHHSRSASSSEKSHARTGSGVACPTHVAGPHQQYLQPTNPQHRSSAPNHYPPYYNSRPSSGLGPSNNWSEVQGSRQNPPSYQQAPAELQ
ncbi:hypothetical protein F5Y19DRAFT_476579 [Xylariaceae sp. FL1651]|nr:hypothetical protein F5Y19DRAFT_476579 [Xylariaceae sp. FL1651]